MRQTRMARVDLRQVLARIDYPSPALGGGELYITGTA